MEIIIHLLLVLVKHETVEKPNRSSLFDVWSCFLWLGSFHHEVKLIKAHMSIYVEEKLYLDILLFCYDLTLIYKIMPTKTKEMNKKLFKANITK